MRIDLLSIFPDYLAPLGLSLMGRAQADGLLSIHTHDLRDWTHDRHRTVDDAPYGGGAGMVMRPEPWGEALDDLLAHGSATGMTPTLVIPSPAGARFEQSTAARLATRPWLLFACGRYEGIDQRVSDHFSHRVEVMELSIGDYVLAGGEAAALVMVEAVARLLPGFVGNPASIVDESYTAGAPGLLEHPIYTRPTTWRGIDVPEVLLSGDHGRIAAWRRSESVRRSARQRPDLVHPTQTLEIAGLETLAEVDLARPADAGELLTLQRCCWVSEAQLNEAQLKQPLRLPALVESLDDVRSGLVSWLTLTVRVGGRLVASVRGRLGEGLVWQIGRLMVAPDIEGLGLGRLLLSRIERAAPPEATSYALFTGAGSERNLRMYAKAGYRRVPGSGSEPEPGVVALVRQARPSDFG